MPLLHLHWAIDGPVVDILEGYGRFCSILPWLTVMLAPMQYASSEKMPSNPPDYLENFKYLRI